MRILFAVIRFLFEVYKGNFANPNVFVANQVSFFKVYQGLPLIHNHHNQHDYRLQQNRRTFINYKKADWAQLTEATESAFAQTNIHTANIIFTNIILMADKHNIPKGKLNSNCMLLPDHIVCKITQRNNIRRANTCDPALKLLNEEITSDIQKHKQNLWKEHLDHRQHTTTKSTLGSQVQYAHSLEDHT